MKAAAGNVLVLGAYVGDNPEKALAAAEKAGVSYPLFAVPYSFYQYITIRPDGTFSIPQACFFDRDGYQINGSYFTARTCDVWARTLEELLAFTASRKTEQQEEDPPAAEAKKPEIQTQPKTATVKDGKKVKFTVVAAGEGLKYQWYYRTSSQAKWKKVSGGTGASLSFTARAKMNGSQYRCRVRNDAGEVYSKTVRVKIRKK